MAVFFFVSGYFLALGGSGFGGVIKKKVKKLLIPYLLWTLAYALLINLLRAYTNINIGVPFEWKEYVLGICFWLYLSKILVPSFGGSRLVNYISNHTFVIMMNHIFFMANVNWVLVLVNRYFAMPGFDINSALTTSWYC